MKLLRILVLACFLLSPPISWGRDLATIEEIRGSVHLGIKKLNHKDFQVRLSAIEVLQAWSSYASEAVPALTMALRDENAEVRAGAAHTLELIGPPARKSVPELTKALSDSASFVRAAAAFALGEIGASSAGTLGALQSAGKNAPPRVALASAFALQKLFPRQAGPISKRREIAKNSIPLLMASFSQPQGFETIRLARAIGHVDPATGFSLVPGLVEIASTKDVAVASNASYALETLGRTSIAFVPGLLQAAQSCKNDKRLTAIRQLGWMRISTPEATRALKEALSSDSVLIRSEAAQAFGRIGTADKPTIRTLARLALSRAGSERRAAAFALLTVSPKTLDELMTSLKKLDPKLAESLERKRLLESL